MKGLELFPISFADACEFIRIHHRYMKPPQGHKYSIAAAKDGKVVGVAMIGRPVSRHLDTGLTLEVRRVATDGTKNACSFLYAAAWRAAKNLGYKKLITYILSSESGVSLYALDWVCVGQAGGGSWNVPSRPRAEKTPSQKKILFEKTAD